MTAAVTIVTEHTPILWVSPDGRVLVWRTLRSRFRYWSFDKTSLIRQYFQPRRLEQLRLDKIS
jgi:hypothetical protein